METRKQHHKNTKPHTDPVPQPQLAQDFMAGEQSFDREEELRSSFGEDFSFPNSEGHTPPKKSKIDKDGFVTPATPDIPVTSVHRSGGEGSVYNTGAMSESASVAMAPESLDTSLGERCESVEGVYDGQTSMTAANPEDTHIKPTSTEIPDQKLGTETDKATVMNPATSYIPFDELLKSCAGEYKALQERSLAGFNELETFEVFSVTRLEKILDDAKSLEQSLLQQREQLRQRVHQLSQTLRLA